MAQALVLSDNEIVNGIYAVNLEVYLGTNATVLDNLDSALKLLELNPNFDIIVCLSLIDGVDCAIALRDYLKANNLDIPLIVIGRQSEIDESEAQVLPASYNIKSLIRTAAKILNITAKEMASRPVPDFFPVSTKIFFNLKTVDCDVYYKVKKTAGESEFLLIINGKTKVWPRIRKYIDEGVTTLYIPSTERLHFANMATEQVIEELESTDLTAEEKVEAIEKGIELVAAEYLETKEASDNVIRLSQACVSAMTTIVKEVPKLKKLLQALMANKSGYLYSHGIMATYVANHIVRRISWGGESHIEKLNFVLFFHDMFLVPIYSKHPHLKYEEDLVFSIELNDEEKETVINHAKLAGEIVQKFPRCPLGADQLILQHHGTTSGMGFATKYKDDISPLAKVIIISEHFVEEMFRSPEGTSTVNKAAILAELKQRYGKSTYTKILESLETLEL